MKPMPAPISSTRSPGRTMCGIWLRFLGLEPAGEDRLADGRGDDRRVERNHHAAPVESASGV